MSLEKPKKTLADYLVVAVSPALIMLLVGSLSFFLVQVFYRGEMAGVVRWVLFWFVLAIVLVARIGIEHGEMRAMIYGLGLAAATWFYLAQTQPAHLLGAALLGIVWWCAHKLTWDCTLIDDDEDASGQGVLQVAWRRKKKPDPKSPKRAPHSPGLWIVYFSLAALPLFGVGQVLLPQGDVTARRIGFLLMVLYLAAALGLLLTTSFVGLRRYLRQRYLQMPGLMALGWIRFGVAVAVLVLAGALVLPRPGADFTWKTLSYRIDYQLRRASEYAARANPHGKEEGKPGHETKPDGKPDGSDPGTGQQGNASDATGKTAGQPSPDSQTPGGQTPGSASSDTPPPVKIPALKTYLVLKTVLILAGAMLVLWGAYRYRHLISQVFRALIAAVLDFFRTLFAGRTKAAAPAAALLPAVETPPFAAFESPFLTGKERVWPIERVIAYSYEAAQAWAKGRGVEVHPEQTPREFCAGLSEQFPEIASELGQLSFLYSHVAYGKKVPEGSELEPLQQLWRFWVDESVAKR